ncbi:MAG: sel1 repeat family protein [Akkermansia sp.]|nr:sel1 repeat family protein [Akkermansia sp.]
MTSTPQQEYEAGAAAFRSGNAAEGAEHLRNAAFAGHAEAQNQLARVYFAQLKTHQDLISLESAAQNGDHVALFVLAMCLIEGRLMEKDTDKALTALKHAAAMGNSMAENMLRTAQG